MIARRYFAPAAVALVGLTACTSVPSTKTVAEEIVEALDAPQAVKDCLTDKLEGYSNDELDVIGEENPNFTSTDTSIPMTPELEAFIADLAECQDGTAPTGTATDGTATDGTATDGSATAGTTDDTATGEPSDTTTATTEG